MQLLAQLVVSLCMCGQKNLAAICFLVVRTPGWHKSYCALKATKQYAVGKNGRGVDCEISHVIGRCDPGKVTSVNFKLRFFRNILNSSSSF